MSLFLPTDDVALYAAGEPDEHGWVREAVGAVPAWSGRASIQLAPALVDVSATGRGGAGPFDPATAPAGTVYLPPETEAVPVVDGMVLTGRGRRFVLAAVRAIPDPVAGSAACVVAELNGVDQWQQ